MKILFITPRFPYPLFTGDSLRAFYFIKELSKTNSIHLLSFIESLKEKEYIPYLEKYCDIVRVIQLSRSESIFNMISNVTLKEPFQSVYYKSKDMKRELHSMVEKEQYDLVHLSLLRMAPYIKEINNTPVVLDHIDCLSLNMETRYKVENNFIKKLIFKIEHKTTKSYEYFLRNIPSIVTSEKDKNALSGYRNIRVISNGIDIHKYKFKNHNTKDIDLIFVGNMRYTTNKNAVLFFIQHIYPKLLSKNRNLNFHIVGPEADKKIRNLADNKHIFVDGLVNDVREYLYRAKVFIAPMQSGTGIQNKILEAMACGVPVITTSYGNNGIQAKDGEEIFLADDPEVFADRIEFLIDNEEMRNKLAKNARIFIEKNFSWETKIRELETFYHDIIKLNSKF